MRKMSYQNTSTQVTCTRCRSPTTVPFTPTPGRPVYCKACFAKRPGAGPRMGQAMPAPRPRGQGRRMLSQRRKGHFVHDALAELEKGGTMDETQRRAFVEMVFTRGARQTSDAAKEYVHEKAEEKLISPLEAEHLAELIDRYTSRQ